MRIVSACLKQLVTFSRVWGRLLEQFQSYSDHVPNVAFHSSSVLAFSSKSGNTFRTHFFFYRVGFGFVSFESEEPAEKVCSIQYHDIKGKKVSWCLVSLLPRFS